MPKSEKYTLSQFDALDWLRLQDDESVDLFIVDLPYESLEKYRAVGTTTRLKVSKSSSNTWFQTFPNSRFEELFVEIYRVAKKNAHVYFMCDCETSYIAKPAGEKARFKFWKNLVWDKKLIGMGYHYRCRYEFILFFEKGKLKLNSLSIPDVLEVPRVHNGYPTEKPVSLFEILIAQSSKEGAVVGDPFMGSAAVGVAALKLGRLYLGNDISDESLKLASSRLQIESPVKIVDESAATSILFRGSVSVSSSDRK